MPSDHVLVKLDFKNAFNSLSRACMIRAVQQFSPDILSFVYSAYASFQLFRGDHTLLSAEGVQQGDPLGPLLFCITSQCLISELHSDFRVFYLDDGALGGSLDDIISDLLHIEEGAARLGLKLNCNKCELICDDVALINSMLSAVPGLLVVGPSHATLLGSPIGHTLSMEECICSKVETLIVMGKRLQLLSSHDALVHLRHSLSIPKVLYFLHTAPCFLTNLLSTFGAHLRTLLSEILNVNLANESAWNQASLPVKAGGIGNGVRRATQLAPSAYLASAAGC